MQIQKLNYVIVFTDRSIKEISTELAHKILQTSMSEQVGMTFEGSYYKFSNIAKVLDMPEYYKQYPDRIPTPVKEFPLATKEPLEEYGTSEGALNGITKGLQKFLDKNPKAENANGLLIDAKKRLRNLEEGVK